MSETTSRRCPSGAVLTIKGEVFPCQTMNDMASQCVDHEGWAHSNRDAEALWSDADSGARRPEA